VKQRRPSHARDTTARQEKGVGQRKMDENLVVQRT